LSLGQPVDGGAGDRCRRSSCCSFPNGTRPHPALRVSRTDPAPLPA
jgi:hypothetical protein